MTWQCLLNRWMPAAQESVTFRLSRAWKRERRTSDRDARSALAFSYIFYMTSSCKIIVHKPLYNQPNQHFYHYKWTSTQNKISGVHKWKYRDTLFVFLAARKRNANNLIQQVICHYSLYNDVECLLEGSKSS